MLQLHDFEAHSKQDQKPEKTGLLRLLQRGLGKGEHAMLIESFL